MREIWEEIPGFSQYQISNKGRLKSFKSRPQNGLVLSNINATGGYLSVVLRRKEGDRYTRIHRLVAEAFIPNPENKREVNHKDSDKQNNRVDNLEWATPVENCRHAARVNPDMLSGMKYHNQVVRPKTISQFTLSGELLAEYPNSVEAQKATGVCQRNILQVASRDEYKPGKTRKQAGGFIWVYAEDIL